MPTSLRAAARRTPTKHANARPLTARQRATQRVCDSVEAHLDDAISRLRRCEKKHPGLGLEKHRRAIEGWRVRFRRARRAEGL